MAKLADLPGVTRRNLYAIDPDLIDTRIGDNCRKFPSVQPLDDLIHSILEEGQLEPCRIRRIADGSLRLVMGSRRLAAIKQINAAGLAPARMPLICDITEATDERAFGMGLAENMQRDGLSPVDLAYSIDRLHAEFKRSYTEIAKRLGRSNAWVTQTHRILALPREVQLAVHRGEVSASAAYEILGLPANEQKLAAERIKAQAQVQVQSKPEAKAVTERLAEGTGDGEEQEQPPPPRKSRKSSLGRDEIRRAKRGEKIEEGGSAPRTRKEIIAFWAELIESVIEDEQELVALAKEILHWIEGRISDKQLVNRLLKALGS